MRTRLLIVPCLALALALSGCGSTTSYAATVNGAQISATQLEDELRDIRANRRYVELLESQNVRVEGSGEGTFNSALTAQMLTFDIFYELVHQEVVRRGIKIAPADREAARQAVAAQMGGDEVLNAFPQRYRDKLVHRRAESETLATALAGGGDEQAVRQYYDTHKEEFEQACVSHVLLDSNDKARVDRVQSRLERGEDFAAVAKAESKDKGSAEKGGDLGCSVTRTSQITLPDVSAPLPELVRAAFEQPVGKAGSPVTTTAGTHFVLVRSRSTIPFEQASASGDVARRLRNAQERSYEEFLTRAVREAKIRVNPKYGRFEPRFFQVVPPQAPSPGGAPAPAGAP